MRLNDAAFVEQHTENCAMRMLCDTARVAIDKHTVDIDRYNRRGDPYTQQRSDQEHIVQYRRRRSVVPLGPLSRSPLNKMERELRHK